MSTQIFHKKNNRMTISLGEYERLKKISRDFGRMIKFVEHMLDVKEARKQLKMGQGISQNKLFKKLGI